jgi:hypothetical protein
MTSRTRISTAAALLASLALAGAGQAATGTTGSHDATASCSPGLISVSASMQVVQSVKGVPATAKGQYVAYRALLYRWNGRSWDLSQTGKWLWGYGSAGQVGSFRSYETSQLESTAFRLQTGGYYSVGVQYYWYANSDVSSGSDYAGAQHTDPGGPNANGWCKL